MREKNSIFKLQELTLYELMTCFCIRFDLSEKNRRLTFKEQKCLIIDHLSILFGKNMTTIFYMD